MTRPGVAASGLLTTADVAAAFRVHQRTVIGWGNAGLIGYLRTPGLHRRYRRAEVQALLGRARTERSR